MIWRKQNTLPCWRKEITVGAILDQQMTGDKSYTPGALGELETMLGDRQRGGYTRKNKN